MCKGKIELEKVIAFYPQIAEALGGDLAATLLLQQIIFWTKASKREGDWIYKTTEDFREETTLSYYQQKRAREKLKRMGLIEIKIKKANGHPVVHYRVDLCAFEEMLKNSPKSDSEETQISILEKLKYGNSRNSNMDIRETLISITENTTENTTDILKDYSEKALKMWNDFASSSNLPKIKAITKARKDKLKKRIKEKDFDLEKIIEAIKEQSFLLGDNKRGWKVDFDWLIQNDTNYIKILERKYAGKKAKTFGGEDSEFWDGFIGDVYRDPRLRN